MALIPFERSLERAVFLERPNRFVAVIQHPAHQSPVKAHVADPGRLKELLFPGVELCVSDHGDNPSRKLRYTVALVRAQEELWVSINSQLPNRLIKTLLTWPEQKKALSGYESMTLVQAEHTPAFMKTARRKSRFDFLLETLEDKPCLLEVKGASLVEEGWCKFPDAPTERGTRHLRELIEALNHGYEARVIFVVQRSDAHHMMPHHRQDPMFALALKDAIEAGVQVKAFAFHMMPEGCRLTGEIPVVIPKLNPI